MESFDSTRNLAARLGWCQFRVRKIKPAGVGPAEMNELCTVELRVERVEETRQRFFMSDFRRTRIGARAVSKLLWR